MRQTSAHDGGQVPIALTIAGSDSGGGAGIQADLKTFSALGVYGCSVVTALTAQNTLGVEAIQAVEPGFIRRQMDAVLQRPRSSGPSRSACSARPKRWSPWPRASSPGDRPMSSLDPVMVAKGGDRLLGQDAIGALRRRLLPLADLITPNLPEAGALLDGPTPTDRSQMVAAAKRLRALGPANVLLKGGHLGGDDSPDLLLAGEAGSGSRLRAWRRAIPMAPAAHCPSAIAALLARGRTLAQAVAEAKQWLSAAIAAADGLGVGGGIGPVHHFHALWHDLADTEG